MGHGRHLKRERQTLALAQSQPQSHTMPPSSSSSEPPTNTPIYFHREHHPLTGYLSQWYPFPLRSPSFPTITFTSAEQYMMYHKALLMHSPPSMSAILAAPTPGLQKSLGRKIKPWDAKLWEREKYRVVKEGTWLKFKDEGLREKLLATGDRELVEASPSDRVWGIGFGAEFAEQSRENWGQNLLGSALMSVRERIREEEGRGGGGGDEVDDDGDGGGGSDEEVETQR